MLVIYAIVNNALKNKEVSIFDLMQIFVRTISSSEHVISSQYKRKHVQNVV